MSDSFADLWSSSAAIPPKPKPQTLANASSTAIHNSTTKGGPKPDAFSFLASSSRQQHQRYSSPNPTPGNPGKRSTTNTPPVSVTPTLGGTTSGLDAFSDLFSSTALSGATKPLNGSVKSPSGMTIAERLAMEAQAENSRRLGEEPRSRTNVSSQDSAWVGLDSLVSGTASAGTSSTPLSQPRPQQKAATLWHDPDAPRNKSRVERGLLDLDDDAADFDFGSGEQKESQDLIGDDDDILGMLSQPVELVKAQTQMQKPSPSPKISREPSFDDQFPSNGRSRLQSTSSSPPPHVLGQLVEMGFSVEEAKKALANTKDGRDVPTALEILLGSRETGARHEGDQAVAEAQEPSLPARKGPPKGLRERERERRERIRRERDYGPSTPPGGSDVVSDMQDHADKLLSQASEIGLSVLTKASVFWKQGKERVAKVYEERAAPPTIHETSAPLSQVAAAETTTSLFSLPTQDRPSSAVSTSLPQAALADTTIRPLPLPTRERPLPAASPSSLSSVDKHRSAGSSQFKLGQYASAVESYSAAIASLPSSHLLLLPLFNNRALARMRTGEYKLAGDDAAQALSVIFANEDSVGASDGFNLDVKATGKQVAIDSWHPSMESSFLLTAAQQKANDRGWAHPQGFGVDLADGYVKALRRRAEASEGRERWSEALKFWEVLSSADSSWMRESLRKEAQRNAARCRKMIADETLASKVGYEASIPKSRVPITKPKPPLAASMPPSAALRSLQASNAQAEAEDNLKYQLKDSVDSKLAAWRTGKETNIRALLASLDMVLWEELLKGIKVGGLHELVMPAQVKKGYLKAIARVHPDKLNAQNSTVEQRMLANGVFGTLSEAWISFQNSNGM